MRYYLQYFNQLTCAGDVLFVNFRQRNFSVTLHQTWRRTKRRFDRRMRAPSKLGAKTRGSVRRRAVFERSTIDIPSYVHYVYVIRVSSYYYYGISQNESLLMVMIFIVMNERLVTNI